MTVPGTEHDHLLRQSHLPRQEALLLLLHCPPKAALVIAAEGPDLTLTVQHHGVHPPSHGVHCGGDLSDHCWAGLLHDVLPQAELASVPLA